MIRVLFTAFIVLLSTNNSFAKDGSSGCGPGWYVLKDNSLVSSSARAITNGILSPVYSLGMTFGTSNCAKHSIVNKDQRSLHFMTASSDMIRSQAASGQGEWLNAYAETFGCSPVGNIAFNHYIRQQYSEVFSAYDPNTIVKNTRYMISSNLLLAKNCSET